ncbi:MAG TPA: 30S ribosomal protein S1 [Pyrinomonadaceae bacterium]|nr:30S ribosomal protein S1 [Chloracidobacterium sp.]MBP9934692.1 30S ribosomal protein S1 [Pyrinomonadaceae bacterium]MBK7804602.1 30S ribosomal protein S1 [Chloracidobacterium sp.]MBK9439073.1 30S ribosomal protein S1 [Chloracidobacterium sp.]MBL0240522.1 30S ribosomal protein S1 [Chloracidobacterium sp.]
MTNEVTTGTEETTAAETSVVDQTAASTTPADITASAEPAAPATDDVQNAGDIDFGAILEQFEQEQTIFHPGELVEGKVVGISDRGILIDFGYKSEGIAPVEDFTGEDGNLTVSVGDSVEVVLRSMHSGDGPPQLSRHDALARKAWDVVERAFNEEATVTGIVLDKTKGGLRVDLGGIEAFLPGSQIDSRPIHSLDQYKGQEIEAKIIKFSRRRNNVVLSRKVLTDEVVGVQKGETLARIDIGYVIEGTIKNLTEYGAFVDIGGIDGLLHVTDMSWGRLHHPGDLFKVGDHIQVKVLKLDREKEKISLGYKQLLPDPWSTVIEVYPVNTKVTGKVSSVTDYGVFVELEAGVEGLVHVSEISWSRRAQSPKRMFNRNDEVEVQVLGVDTVERRISLGMKQFQENPWATVDIRYPIGTKIHGRVRNITDFGAFVELEEGIDGLVHVSDITWAKKIKHPKDVLKKDQEVDAIVTSIDKQGQRLSLSMKDLTPSAWEGFVATHRPGDTVRGKVSRFTNFGIFVELGEGLEGLCHISELSDDRVERAEDVAQLGQEMDFKILRIEQADQKIGLSARAVGKEDEPVVDSRMYSTEAKGGMASLGELANLRFGGEADASTEAKVEETPEEKKAAKVAAKKAKAEEFAAREAEAQVAEELAAASAEDEPAVEEAVAEVSAADETAEETSVAIESTEEESTAEETSVETPSDVSAAVDSEAAVDTAVEETVAEVDAPPAEVEDSDSQKA